MGWDGDGSFNVQPGAVEYVDVLRVLFVGSDEVRLAGNQLEIVYQDERRRPRRVTIHPQQTLTLRVVGDEGQPAQSDFVFEWTANTLDQPRFFQAPESP